MRLLLLISIVLFEVMSSQALSLTSYYTATQERNSDMHKSNNENQLVQDISYSYELVSDNGKLNCIGTLNFSLNLPSGTSHLILERSIQRSKIDIPGMIIFSLKSVWPNTTTNITKQDIYWGTYFRIRVVFEDNTDVYSPIYSVNDYIETSDLELLQSQESAAIDNIEADDDNVCIYINNKNLGIDSKEPISINVFDLYGRSIFNSDMVTTETIPLNNVASKFIIVRYQTSKNIITKKFLLQ
ncbi:MAG: hypothetical protein HDR82_11125 [Bacteroides sp.]|nr:hypothetical protein [Bacteroides sp.]